MPPSESEILAIRLARIKQLIAVLDDLRGRTAEQEEAFLKLKAEIDAARESLKIIT